MSYWPCCKNTKPDGSSSLLLCGSRYLEEWGEGQADSEVSVRKNAKLSLMDLQQTIKTEVKYSTSLICSSTRLCLITNLRFLHFSTLQFKLKYPSSSFWNTFSFISSNNWQSIKAHPHRFFLWWCQGFQRNKTESESVVHYCFLVQVIILTEG